MLHLERAVFWVSFKTGAFPRKVVYRRQHGFLPYNWTNGRGSLLYRMSVYSRWLDNFVVTDPQLMWLFQLNLQIKNSFIAFYLQCPFWSALAILRGRIYIYSEHGTVPVPFTLILRQHILKAKIFTRLCNENILNTEVASTSRTIERNCNFAAAIVRGRPPLWANFSSCSKIGLLGEKVSHHSDHHIAGALGQL